MNYIRLTKITYAVLVLIGLSTQAYALVYHGGGVLPYAIDPKTHKVYFLFSREAHGLAKGYWADFGGKADKTDNNRPEKIATRECSEESNNLFGRSTQLLNYLKNSPSAYKIDTPYALFLAHVAYKRDIDKLFQRKLAKAHTVHHKEKDKIMWVPAKSIEHALRVHSSRISLPNGKTITLRPHMLGILNKARRFIQKLSRGIVPKGHMLILNR